MMMNDDELCSRGGAFMARRRRTGPGLMLGLKRGLRFARPCQTALELFNMLCCLTVN